MVSLDQFVTIKQAAKLLGVSVNTLRNWHRDARLPDFSQSAQRVSLVQED